MRGSRASRRPSPRKVKERVSRPMQVAGTQTSCGDELIALSESYKRVAGYDKERLKSQA